MAKAQGVSKATINRIRQGHHLQPHRIRNFKLARDSQFLEKLTGVVGLYLNPPEQAWCCAWMRRARFKPWTGRSRDCRSKRAGEGP